MSHIPSSAMPHAKPHNEHDQDYKPEHGHTSGQQLDHQQADKAEMTPAPSPPAPAQATTTPQPAPVAATSSEPQGSEGGKAPWGIALAVGGVLAIGTAVAAVVFRGEDKPAKKEGGKRPSAKAERKAAKKSAG